MIETTLTPVISVGTVISAQSYKSPDVNESLTTEIIQQNQVSIQPINTGLIGPIGPQGPQGPEYQGDDLPDFTLIFDNKLI